VVDGLVFHNDKVDNLDANLGGRGYFELFFIMTDVGNLFTNLGGYFGLSFVMAEVGNLDAKLGGYLCIFQNSRGG